MGLDKFITTEKNLGDSSWRKPQHVLDAIKNRREESKSKSRSVDRASMTRDCGTGAGGFKPGNECAKGGDGSGEGDSKPSIGKGKSDA